MFKLWRPNGFVLSLFLGSVSVASPCEFLLTDALNPKPTGKHAMARLERGVLTLAEYPLGLRRLERIYQKVRLPQPEHPESHLFDRLLSLLKINIEGAESLASGLPPTGPAVIVANHTFGILDGAVLMSAALRVRKDVKIIASDSLATIPELQPWFFFVDVYNRPEKRRQNVRAMQEIIEWVNSGKALIVFPSGNVSSLPTFLSTQAVEGAWIDSMVKLIGKTSATIVPVYVSGQNSSLYLKTKALKAALSTPLLIWELLNKSYQTVHLRAGSAVSAKIIPALKSAPLASEALRALTLNIEKQNTFREDNTAPALLLPLESAVAPIYLEAEIARLPPEALLIHKEQWRVYISDAASIPNILRELGRLREDSFRAVGEGSGNSLDLDVFDAHYKHLFVWNSRTREIVGAYRVGLVDELTADGSFAKLYTASLFDFTKDFLNKLGVGTVELGRSFVAPHWQRSVEPLNLLWKGISEYLLRNPTYHKLLGPVSISHQYSSESRRLIREYLMRDWAHPELASSVAAKNPPAESLRLTEQAYLQILADTKSLPDLANSVSLFEASGRKLPVLIRQYIKIGGLSSSSTRFIAFSEDPNFHSLDGLLLVDLRKSDLRALKPYFGEVGARVFVPNDSFHDQASTSLLEARD